MGLLSTYFSKNMAVNLLVAMVVTSLVAVNNKVREGFEDKKEGVQALEEEGGDIVCKQPPRSLSLIFILKFNIYVHTVSA